MQVDEMEQWMEEMRDDLSSGSEDDPGTEDCHRFWQSLQVGQRVRLFGDAVKLPQATMQHPGDYRELNGEVGTLVEMNSAGWKVRVGDELMAVRIEHVHPLRKRHFDCALERGNPMDWLFAE